MENPRERGVAMADSNSAKNLSAGQETDSAKGVAGETALKAIAHLQKVAASLAEDAARIEAEPKTDAPEIKVVEEGVATPSSAARSTIAAPAPPAAWGRAAAFATLGLAIALSAYLGVRDGAEPVETQMAAMERKAPPSAEALAIHDLQRKVADLTKETHTLRALAQKQAGELRTARTHANSAASAAASASSAAGQTAAKLDRFEKETATRFEQQTARVERLERLAADPIVTSSIDKKAKATTTPPRKSLRTPSPSMPENSYVLRSVRNGVAVVQTRRGLIEVGPGDVIPGVGRVQRIARIDGRWVVVMRDGYIDQDAD